MYETIENIHRFRRIAGFHSLQRQHKALIVFFSHVCENYAVGNIEVGNTKIVVDYIQEQTGADVFEIVAEKNYDMPYSELIK